MNRVIVWIFFTLVAMGATSCGVDVGYNTTLILKAWIQPESGAELQPDSEVRLYGYNADTTDWRIASYEAALEGRFIAANGSGEELLPELSGSPIEVEGYSTAQSLNAEGYRRLMVLAIDTRNRLYGYTQYALTENLPQMYVSLVFQPWKKSKAFKNGTWWMFNDFYVPDITARVRPTIEESEGAEPQNLKGVSLFVYNVEEPSEWLPTNYEQATTGQLVNRSTGEVILPTKNFSGDSTGVISMSFPEGDYLMMAIDFSTRSYALREFLSTEASTEIPLRFSPWQELSPYSYEGWSIYHEPAVEPENPTDPDQGEPQE